MSATAIRCETLPVREEVLGHDVLATVQGGAYWPIIRRGAEELAKGYLVKEACDAIDTGWNRVTDWWEEYQAEAEAEADAEALDAARHEMRRQYWNKRG